MFDATSRFHHPAHAEEWNEAGVPARIDALFALQLRGLEAPRKQ
jgi:Tetracyclin repressor-like, C-terminal domain